VTRGWIPPISVHSVGEEQSDFIPSMDHIWGAVGK